MCTLIHAYMGVLIRVHMSVTFLIPQIYDLVALCFGQDKRKIAVPLQKSHCRVYYRHTRVYNIATVTKQTNFCNIKGSCHHRSIFFSIVNERQMALCVSQKLKSPP